ncbi:MAG TPA: HEAT repeat domain-containing protein [Polyangiales bacterium]
MIDETVLKRLGNWPLMSALVFALGWLAPLPLRADPRGDFLIKMLASSDQFRVRTQAALALGSRAADPAAVNALMAALKDDHPAVRAASAGALELLKDSSALVALKVARKDKDAGARAAIEHAITTLERAAAPAAPEPSGSSVYYVAIGTPSAQVGLPAPALRELREHVVKEVSGLNGVRIAPENEGQAAATNVLRSKKLVGYYLDSSVTKIEQKPDGALRAQVSIIVGTYPGRAMRVMLSGAATVTGSGSGDSAKVQAVEAAFTGALRRLPQAMESGIARAE